MRTAEELKQWQKEHSFPENPTPPESARWHLAALEFEFGPGSYVLLETLPSAGQTPR